MPVTFVTRVENGTKKSHGTADSGPSVRSILVWSPNNLLMCNPISRWHHMVSFHFERTSWSTLQNLEICKAWKTAQNDFLVGCYSSCKQSVITNTRSVVNPFGVELSEWPSRLLSQGAKFCVNLRPSRVDICACEQNCQGHTRPGWEEWFCWHEDEKNVYYCGCNL